MSSARSALQSSHWRPRLRQANRRYHQRVLRSRQRLASPGNSRHQYGRQPASGQGIFARNIWRSRTIGRHDHDRRNHDANPTRLRHIRSARQLWSVTGRNLSVTTNGNVAGYIACRIDGDRHHRPHDQRRCHRRYLCRGRTIRPAPAPSRSISIRTSPAMFRCPTPVQAASPSRPTILPAIWQRRAVQASSPSMRAILPALSELPVAAQTAVLSLTAASIRAPLPPPASQRQCLLGSASPVAGPIPRLSTAPFPAPSTPPPAAGAAETSGVVTGLSATLGSSSSNGSASLDANGPITVTGIARSRRCGECDRRISQGRFPQRRSRRFQPARRGVGDIDRRHSRLCRCRHRRLANRFLHAPADRRWRRHRHRQRRRQHRDGNLRHRFGVPHRP